MAELQFTLWFDQRGSSPCYALEFYRKVSIILVANRIATEIRHICDLKVPVAEDSLRIAISYTAKNSENPRVLTIDNIRENLLRMLKENDLYSNFQITQEN
ncbi:hypothetical protein P22_1916 [Propionispora sp. 2/2-37]|uniref:hypothetical protein n=1 Tax=Propionispora sp. 2/2-37 TaxID=1677858 RepID=UPI0006BB8E2D|nr:hypothetical protein [Propionispora sp. 2/2-37]CUH95831.1 hypothetical protein P22_1916 [Propionispora sp. 2/2-37]